MKHWIIKLTAGIKNIIDSNTDKSLPISAKLAFEKELNTDRL
jgi:hypothetical protein